MKNIIDKFDISFSSQFKILFLIFLNIIREYDVPYHIRVSIDMNICV